MTEPLKCTKLLKKALQGTDPQGKVQYKYILCGEPAAEYEFGGLLTTARATLCERHKEAADRQNFVSKNGYKHGRVKKKHGKPVMFQERLPGTGLL